MTERFYTRNVIVLAKAQAAQGTEETPTVGSDAVRVRDEATPQANMQSSQSGYLKGEIDASEPISNGGSMSLPLKCWMTGAGTAGTAPDWGKHLLGCAMQAVLTASAVTGTAQDGDTGTITLASSGSSSTDDAYIGMPITIDGGTGDGQTRVISGYVGTSKVASVYPDWDTAPDSTSTYTIAANARYAPITQGQKNLTLVQYLRNAETAGNALRRRQFDSMGDYSIALTPKQPVEIAFTFQGLLPAVPDDVSDPGDATYTGADPESYMGAQTWLGGDAVKINNFTLRAGNGIQMFDDPAAQFGTGPAEITTRTITGTITPPLTLAATRNAFADWIAGTTKPLWLCWGSASGKMVSIFIPSLLYTGNQPGNTNGRETEQLPFQVVGPIYIAVF